VVTFKYGNVCFVIIAKEVTNGLDSRQTKNFKFLSPTAEAWKCEAW
jgi:hypothetical protein